jgi:hypothetical protein
MILKDTFALLNCDRSIDNRSLHHPSNYLRLPNIFLLHAKCSQLVTLYMHKPIFLLEITTYVNTYRRACVKVLAFILLLYVPVNICRLFVLYVHMYASF